MKKQLKWIENHIKINLKKEKEDFYQINQMYIKLALVKILYNKESDIAQIIKKMSKLKYDNVNEDINDLKEFIDSLNNANKIKFDYYIYSSYLLFEENLISNLKKLFKWKK